MRRWILAFGVVAIGTLAAAPRLRLGPSVALTAGVTRGTDGQELIVVPANAGDGQLNLSVAATVDWLEAIHKPGDQIRILLRTARLASGTYTGFVIVSDPAAEDAPQSISVTVTVATLLPDEIQLYVKPGKSQEWRRTISSVTLAITKQPPGGPTLSLSSSGFGTLGFIRSYTLTASAPPETEPGDYAGTLGSSVANSPPIPVRIRVSGRDPITASPASLQFRAAEFFGPQRQTIRLEGVAPFQVREVETASEPWLSAGVVNEREVIVAASPQGLAPGNYSGEVVIRSDAANDILRIPVTMEVFPYESPAIIARIQPTLGVPYAALPRGGLATMQGDLFASGSGSLRLFLNNRPVRILDASESTSISFQIPFDADAGTNLLRLDRDGFRGMSFAADIPALRPRLLWAQTPTGNIITNNDSSRRPIIRAGDTVELFGDGFGLPEMDVLAGEPAPENVRFQDYPGILIFSGRRGVFYRPKPIWAGLAPGTVGLSKLVFVVPEELRGAGDVLVNTDPSNYSSLYIRVE